MGKIRNSNKKEPKIKNIEDLRTELLLNFEAVLEGELDPKICDTSSLTAQRILTSLSLELKEKTRINDTTPIEFLQGK